MMNNRTRLIPCLLLALFTWPLGSCTSTEQAADPEAMFQTHYDFAFAYYAMGPEAFERCQQQIYKAFEYDEDHVELRVLLGQVLVRKGGLEDIASAELVYRSLIDDDDPRAPLGLALSLERRGNFYDEASRRIASGERFTESEDPAERAIELAYEAKKLWDESEEYYLQALDIRNDDRAVLNGLQRIKALQQLPAESLAYSTRLLEICNSEHDFWKEQLTRPDITARDEDSMRATVTDLETLMVRTHLHASNLSVDLKNNLAALDHLAAIARLRPALAAVHSRRAQLFKRVGDFPAALYEIDEFLRLSQLPFEHPDVNAAYELKNECEKELKS